MSDLTSRIGREPRICFWEITDACNLRCIHCECDAGARAEDELSPDEALALADDLAAAGCRTVNLTGGEPLVRGDWSAIARRLVDRGVEVTLITNGLLVDDRRVAEMVDAGVTGVSVSLDGTREVHDAIRLPPGAARSSRYDRALEAIRRLAASPMKTAVITQIHRRNLDDLEAIHDLVAALGADLWQVQLAMPLGRLWRLRDDYLVEPSALEPLCARLAAMVRGGGVTMAVADNIGYYGREEPILRGARSGREAFWVGCLAGVRVVALCSNGDVKGCPSHPRSFVVGSVRETPFAEIWAEGARFPYNTAWQEKRLEGLCARCEHRHLCRAGCTTMAFASTGTIYDNPFCVQRARLAREGRR